ncbi:hypothetical protein [Kitasatospora sp. McL0602]|uniref:hypothetical protein n=1 Tax=Kitasatospora sp. McL0602 TaxID=3439530 RepID=UPI003F8A6D18
MAALGAAGAPRRAPAERGRLRLADRVLAGIAATAVREALAAASGARPRTPRVTVSASHGTARLTLGLTLPFPADLAALAAVARDAAAEHCQTMTGTRIREVVVVVERLVPTDTTR